MTMRNFQPGGPRAVPEPRRLAVEMGAKRKPLTPVEREQWEAVAKRLAELRGGKSAATTAREVGVTEGGYRAWEKGASRISPANLKRLGQIYGVTENYILYGQDKPVRRSQLDRIEHQLGTLTRAVEAASAQALRGDPLQGLETLLRELQDAKPSDSLEGKGSS